MVSDNIKWSLNTLVWGAIRTYVTCLEICTGKFKLKLKLKYM